MTKNPQRRCLVVALLAATAALELGANQARAFYGMGFGAFNWVPQPGDFLNQHALMNAANATRGPVQRPVYGNNPNSYLNRIRDNGFSSHYDPGSRSSPGSSVARRRQSNVTQTSNTQPPPAAVAAAPAVPKPVLPIGSFFDTTRRLVWPNDAPVAGDLHEKRNVSDQSCLTVSDLVDQHGSAPITTVTTARQKLIEYGQPALQFLRSQTTPRVAESFHLFLLSLYESLAQAVNPVDSSPVSNSTP